MYPPPTKFSVPKRNTGKSVERPAKILRGLQRFGKNLRVVVVVVVVVGAVALSLWFQVSDCDFIVCLSCNIT